MQKTVAQTKGAEAAESTADITPAILRDALQQVKNEDGPKSPEERETYFMTQVGIGEQLAAQGTSMTSFVNTLVLTSGQDHNFTFLPPWLSSGPSECTLRPSNLSSFIKRRSLNPFSKYVFYISCTRSRYSPAHHSS